MTLVGKSPMSINNAKSNATYQGLQILQSIYEFDILLFELY